MSRRGSYNGGSTLAGSDWFSRAPDRTKPQLTAEQISRNGWKVSPIAAAQREKERLRDEYWARRAAKEIGEESETGRKRRRKKPPHSSMKPTQDPEVFIYEGKKVRRGKTSFRPA